MVFLLNISWELLLRRKRFFINLKSVLPILVFTLMEYGGLNLITFVFLVLFLSALLFSITGLHIRLSLNPFFLRAPNID